MQSHSPEFMAFLVRMKAIDEANERAETALHKLHMTTCGAYLTGIAVIALTTTNVPLKPIMIFVGTVLFLHILVRGILTYVFVTLPMQTIDKKYPPSMREPG